MAVRLSKLPKRLTAFHLWMVYQLTWSVVRSVSDGRECINSEIEIK